MKRVVNDGQAIVLGNVTVTLPMQFVIDVPVRHRNGIYCIAMPLDEIIDPHGAAATISRSGRVAVSTRANLKLGEIISTERVPEMLPTAVVGSRQQLYKQAEQKAQPGGTQRYPK